MLLSFLFAFKRNEVAFEGCRGEEKEEGSINISVFSFACTIRANFSPPSYPHLPCARRSNATSYSIIVRIRIFLYPHSSDEVI